VSAQGDPRGFRNATGLAQRLSERLKGVLVSRARESERGHLPHHDVRWLVTRERAAHGPDERATRALLRGVRRERAYDGEPLVRGSCGAAGFERVGEQFERGARARGAELLERAQAEVRRLTPQERSRGLDAEP
jgi:hypothetical protein